MLWWTRGDSIPPGLLNAIKSAVCPSGLVSPCWNSRARSRRGSDGQFAGEAGDRLDAAVVQADLDKLVTKTKTVKKYVDKHLAHKDLRKLTTLPTWTDLDSAIDCVGELFRRLVLLLRQADRSPIAPCSLKTGQRRSGCHGSEATVPR